MTHFTPCITIALRDFPDCHAPATFGAVCEACYERVDVAIRRYDHLRAALAGIDRAITPERSSAYAGPRLPLSAIRVDFDEIWSYRRDSWDLTAIDWVQTRAGAKQAVRFARAVHRADLAHPTVAQKQKLHRVRCPQCRRLTAVVNTPDWYGQDTTITCIAKDCDWQSSNPDAVSIVADIETHGQLGDADLIMLELRERRRAERAAREARAAAKRAEAENGAA